MSQNEGKSKESSEIAPGLAIVGSAMCFGFGVFGIPIHVEEI